MVTYTFDWLFFVSQYSLEAKRCRLLINAGNTCFADAVLTGLAHVPEFLDAVKAQVAANKATALDNASSI